MKYFLVFLNIITIFLAIGMFRKAIDIVEAKIAVKLLIIILIACLTAYLLFFVTVPLSICLEL